MLQLHCSGTPREMGHTHGHNAKLQVHGSINFYRNLFQQKCALDWPAVTREAEKYVPQLEATCPRYLDEMRGIGEGAGVGFLDIVALNVRTEIMFGLFTEAEAVRAKGAGAVITTANGNGVVNGEHKTEDEKDFPSDGCTSLSLHPPSSSSGSFLAQNWDWQPAQSPNLIILHITPSPSPSPSPLPSIAMVTEAGIIGKIGLNSSGVGVCLNAIRARGLDTSRLPVHLALRTLLESRSLTEGKAALRKLGGVAGSAHILLADPTSAVGLEFAGGREEIGEILPDAKGRVVHTNHLLLEHPGVDEPGWLPDSGERLLRMGLLTDSDQEREALVNVAGDGVKVDFQRVLELFKDEKGFPCSINRLQVKEGESQTLFSIIMDLGGKRALIKVGRPTKDGEEIYLGFK
ncbi:hypothetical protein KVR01_000044 [Diaporthe batatas]|uniref:uncharacterized protein n=1 Tax=Diaporthe batatas TaxID=748121 RepID=UPI001D03BB50|nr:uncharacterized protein KVR01_000044 [Diaporthe batatas]KAG8169299.1 hypothetical protein KVR01_000044 [Diaporthe batatas]